MEADGGWEVPASEAQTRQAEICQYQYSRRNRKGCRGGQGSAGIGIGYNSWAKSRITITGGRTDARGGSRSSGENTTSGVGGRLKNDDVEFFIDEKALIMHGLSSADENVTAQEINQKTTGWSATRSFIFGR